MKIGKTTRFVLLTLSISSSLMAGACDDYLSENLSSGITPKFVDGKLKSLSMYASSAFLAPKTSLINKARRKAEMRAKRSFSEWIKERIAANTLTADLLDQVEKTDQNGNTEGIAEEITQSADTITNGTESVLSGIIKLDECMDREGKEIFVRVGWKPSLSKAAADTRATIDNEIERGESGKVSSSGSSSTKATSVKSYRSKSPLADDF